MPFKDWKKSFDVLLVQPDQGSFVKSRIFHPGIEVPLNLTSLAAYFEINDIQCEILDLRLFDYPYKILEYILKEYRFPIVGISAYTSEIDNAGKVAKMAKRLCPSVKIIVGGYHASAIPKETLYSFKDFDYIIQGEGEISFTGLVKKLINGRDIEDHKGLVYRTFNGIKVNPRERLISNLDGLPITARHKVPVYSYQPKPATGNFMSLPSTGIMSSRGCQFQCAYCSKGVWGRSIRFRSPENVVKEIEHCVSTYGIYDFRFYDDALTNTRWDLQRFCRILVDKGLKINWNCYSRVDHVNEEKLRWMKEAGCYHIKYGVEFGTEKALKIAKKDTTLDQARYAINITKKLGIECKASFIFGIPGETLEDCKKTLDFAIELSPDLASFYPFDLFPGSRFHVMARKDMKTHLMYTLPREVSERFAKKAYYRFYMRPHYIVQRTRRLFMYPKRELVVLGNGMKMMGKFLIKSILKRENL